MRHFPSSLLLTCALSALSVVSPAQAQGSADAANSGDIIVTARRVEERLQDVPISITVYSQEQIANRNIAIATDLATFTPSLSINQRFGPEKALFGLRGFNQDNGTAPAVGVYFADVVGVRAQGGTASGNTVGAGTFLDLQNVQVLKGPQGTLQGRNTTGGAILLVPNRPTDRLEGWIEGSAGNYEMWRAQGVVNVPLNDTIRVRVAVDRHKRDGYMKNQSTQGPDNFSDLNYFYGRASIAWDMTDDLENLTIFHYSHSFGRNYASKIVACNPAPAASAFFTAPAGCAQLMRQGARGDGLLDVEVDIPKSLTDIKTWQAINTMTWKVSDNLTFKNIFSYGEFVEDSQWDLYSGDFTYPPTGAQFRYVALDLAPYGHTSAERTVTDEFQLQGSLGDDKFVWQAGAYFEWSRPKGWTGSHSASLLYCTDATTINCANLLPGSPGRISASKTKLSFDNHGLYAQGTFKFTDQLSMTGGFRYTFDKIFGITESTAILSVGTPNQVRRCNDSLRFRQPNSATAVGKIVADGVECHFEMTNKSNKPTWLIDLDYKPTPDTLIYAKYSRGYRQGGINFTNVGVEPWGPEKVDAYEIGAKATFRGSISGYVNVAAFYNDFNNQQIAASLGTKNPAVIAGGRTIINTGTSRIQGFEADGSLKLFEGFQLDFGYTHLSTKLKSISIPTLDPNSPFLGVFPTAQVGQPLNYAPKHRITATATYTLPLDKSVGDISLAATVTHTTSQIGDATMPAFVTSGPYTGVGLGVVPKVTLLNLNVTWKDVLGSNFDAAFFATNVTNEIYAAASGGGWNTAGFGDIIVAQPRIWGFRLRYNFGS